MTKIVSFHSGFQPQTPRFSARFPELKGLSPKQNSEEPYRRQPDSSGAYWRKVLFLNLINFASQIVAGIVSPPIWLPPAEASPNSHWGDNISVYATSSQRHPAFIAPTSNNWYTLALMDTLRQPEVESINQAQKRLMENGYDSILGITQYPVMSAKTIDAWNKKDTSPQRFVLIITGDDAERRVNNAQNLTSTLQEVYNVPSEHIVTLLEATLSDVERKIQDLKEVVQEIETPVEILIYYNGHGTNTGFGGFFPNYVSGKEGDAQGIVQLTKDNADSSLLRKFLDFMNPLSGSLKESHLQQLLNEQLDLANVKIVLMMDTCHSGSWVAEAPAKNPITPIV